MPQPDRRPDSADLDIRVVGPDAALVGRFLAAATAMIEVLGWAIPGAWFRYEDRETHAAVALIRSGRSRIAARLDRPLRIHLGGLPELGELDLVIHRGECRDPSIRPMAIWLVIDSEATGQALSSAIGSAIGWGSVVVLVLVNRAGPVPRCNEDQLKVLLEGDGPFERIGDF